MGPCTFNLISAALLALAVSTSVTWAKVAGGFKAYEGQFPAFISIRLTPNEGGSQFYCSGVLIAENLVLTAAHCFKDGVDKSEVSDGIYAPIEWSLRGIEPHEVVKKCISDKFSSDENGRTFYDVAILKLATPIQTKLAVLPEEPISPQKQAYALGTGYMDQYAFSPDLKTLPVKKVDCGEDDVAESHICFRGNQGKYLGDTCRGDSGGPVLVLRQKVQILYGLTSYGDSTCQSGHLGTSVNFDVYQHKDHINELISQCQAE